MPSQPTMLSDKSLELILQQSPYGGGGVARLVRSARDPDRLRAMWAGLPVYRLASTDFRNRYDQALKAAEGRGEWGTHVLNVIQTKKVMLAAPGSFPFCLGPRQWAEHCQQLWGGMIDSTDYRPPSVLSDTLMNRPRFFGDRLG